LLVAGLPAGESAPDTPPVTPGQNTKPNAPNADDVFKDLDTSRQERLYYTMDQLPESVNKLTEKDIAISAFVKGYNNSIDEIKRFNLILILDKKLCAGQYKGDDKTMAIEFLRQKLKSGNPWIKTEAVYALGNIRADNAKEDILGCLDDKSITASYHAYVAYRLTFNEEPALTDEQMERIMRFDNIGNNIDEINKLADKELSEFRIL
jgi:hypothetical protein